MTVTERVESVADQPLIPTMGLLGGLKFFGQMAAGKAPGEAFGAMNRRTGADMMRIPLGFTDVVFASGPEVANTIALNKAQDFSAEPAWNFTLTGQFRKALLQKEFAEHRHDRLLIQQSLTPKKLDEYLVGLEPKIRAAVMQCPVGDEVDLRRLFKRVTMTVALEVFAGVKLSEAEVFRIGKAFDDLVTANRFVRQARARRYIRRTVRSWIPVKRAHPGDDLMSHLCQAESVDGDKFTDDEVMHHMIFFLFAAHDTSTITMTNMAYYIGLNRKWQTLAREEALALGPELTMADIKELKMLDMIMKETLRFRTPVPLLQRSAIRETSLQGYRVRKNTFISTWTWAHHTNPEVWDTPTRFDPERFTPERHEDKAHRGQWMPFGGGAHKCIGMYFARMEIFTLFHTLLREFEWSVEDDYVLPTMANSLAMSNGFPARVWRRDPSIPERPASEEPEIEIRWGTAPNVLRKVRALREHRVPVGH
ncbi:cytochrome P450 [Jongsikchunia kroppenstedtii]|uniref:cytochrome P450 n=1 Tax=Jongsikchunia kroppenstedtii TaxID=1121721 RepID=UPI0003A06498|nr:cytochrome P450 [Jongsikchunia kroppenstedtii]